MRLKNIRKYLNDGIRLKILLNKKLLLNFICIFSGQTARLHKTPVGRAIYGERSLRIGLFGLKSASAFSAAFGAGTVAEKHPITSPKHSLSIIKHTQKMLFKAIWG
jgi:hypothetical protein